MFFRNQNKFIFILYLFFIWRITLFIVAITSQYLLAYDPSFPYADSILISYHLPQWLYSWANFDGVHYLTIVTKGYIGTAFIQAFFPFYPLLVASLDYLIKNTLLSGLLISNFSFIALLFYFYKLIKDEYSEKLAKYSILALMFFPTSFYFGAVYTESLFLLLVILTFYFAKQHRYLASISTIILATATRIVGVFLIPALIIEIIFNDFNFYQFFKLYFTKPSTTRYQKLLKQFKLKLKLNKKQIKYILLSVFGLTGMLLYMLFLQKNFNDPLYFFHVQAEFGGGVRQETLVSYPQVVYRYIKILLTARPFNYTYLIALRELTVGIGGLLIILYSFTKVHLSYFIFSFLAFILPTLTGTFSSMPRYILVSFSIFIVLTSWLDESIKFRYFYFSFSTILLAINTILFIQGYWVA